MVDRTSDQMLHDRAEATESRTGPRTATGRACPVAAGPSASSGSDGRAAFKEALANLAAGVVVVTTVDGGGQPHGFTASAFTSVSLDPPTVLFCLSTSAQCFSAFADADEFAVSILGGDQEETATRFATRGVDKFAQDDIVRRDGAYFVRHAAASLKCRRQRRIDCGDHAVFLAQVTDAEAAESAGPLVYYKRGFLRQGKE